MERVSPLICLEFRMAQRQLKFRHIFHLATVGYSNQAFKPIFVAKLNIDPRLLHSYSKICHTKRHRIPKMGQNLYNFTISTM